MDRYTKVVLTLIAFALWANLFLSLSPEGAGLIRNAAAQANLPGNHPAIVSVNLQQINGFPFQKGLGVPVIIERQDAPLTVGLATLPLPVTASQPLPVAASQPLAVTAKDPLPVLVTRLPPPAVTSTPSQ